MKKLTLIIPCYNEEAALPFFYKSVKKTLASISFEAELLFINDGSKDKTLDILKELANSDATVTYISLSRNFGKEAAMYAGFCNATGDYVAVMDADMQDPPLLLPQMLSILEEGTYDSVATHRSNRKGESPIRSFFAKQFYKFINRVSDADIMDGARDFRLMKKEMVEAIVEMGEYNRFSKGIFGWIGFKTYWLEFDNVERIAGKTKWNFWKLFSYGIDGIINFSHVLLDIVSFLGVFLTIIAFLAVIFVVVRKIIYGDPVAGWASTMCVVTFIGGVQLFSMGVIGQYISKIYMETKKRPHYIVAETNNDEIKRVM